MQTHAEPSAAVAPDRAQRWWGRALSSIVPSAAEIRRDRPLLVPILMVCVINVASASAFAALLPAQPRALSGVGSTAVTAMWVIALATPVILPLKLLFLAALAWAIAVLIGDEIELRTLGSVLAYGEIILALAGASAVLVVWAAGPSILTGPGAAVVLPSVDTLIRASNAHVAAGLRSVTIFHVAWLGYIVAVVPRVSSAGRWTAAAIASGLAGVFIGLAVLRSLFLV